MEDRPKTTDDILAMWSRIWMASVRRDGGVLELALHPRFDGRDPSAGLLIMRPPSTQQVWVRGQAVTRTPPSGPTA